MLLKNGGNPGDKAKLFPQRNAGPGFHPSPQPYWGADAVLFLPYNRAGRAGGPAEGCRCTNLTLLVLFYETLYDGNLTGSSSLHRTRTGRD